MFHPAFYAMSRLHLRFDLRAKGLSRDQVLDGVDAAEDDVIDAVCASPAVQAAVMGVMAGSAMAVPTGEVGAIFDGSFIQKVLAFFDTPLGKAIKAALLAVIMAMLGF